MLTVAGLSKDAFIGLVLTFGRQYLGHAVGLAIAVDLVMVVLFVTYLTRALRLTAGVVSQV